MSHWLSERLHGAEILFTDSGTSALGIALSLAANGERRPIALPAFGCFDLATAVRAAGLPYVLYDISPATLAPDDASLRHALSVRPAAVVVAHLYGHPVDTSAVGALAAEAGALVIDDAAQGIGASLHGVAVGAGGALGVLSFGRGKGLTGCGGGALVVPRESPARARAEMHALSPRADSPWMPLVKGTAQWSLARPALYGIPARLPFLGLGETPFLAPHAATGIQAFSCGVLSETRHLAEAEATQRRANAARLIQRLEGGALVVPRAPTNSAPGFLRLPVLVPEARLTAAHAVSSRRLGIMPTYPKSLADLEGFGADRLLADSPMDGARQLARRLVTLPTHGGLAERDLRALERWIDSMR